MTNGRKLIPDASVGTIRYSFVIRHPSFRIGL